MDDASARHAYQSDSGHVGVGLLMFLVLSACALAAIWVNVKPKYRVTGSLRVAPFAQNLLGEDPPPLDVDRYEAYVNTQAASITSPDMLQRVADDLARRDLKFFQRRHIGPRFSRVRKVLNPSALGENDPVAILQRALDDGTIEVKNLDKTELIEIGMIAADPDEARQVVRAFLTNFTAMSDRQASDRRVTAIARLARARDMLATKIEGLQENILELSAAYTNTDSDSRRAVEQRIAESLQTELIEVRGKRIALRAEIAVLNQSVDSNCTPMQFRQYEQADPQIQALDRKMAELKIEQLMTQVDDPNGGKRIERKLNLLTAHRKERRDELEHESTELHAEQQMDRLTAAQAELERLDAYERILENQVLSLELEVREAGEPSIELLAFKARFDSYKRIYDQITYRLCTMEIEGSGIEPRISLAAQADLAEVIEPRWLLSGIALGSAFLLSLLLTIARARRLAQKQHIK